jgi:hypothetical protein
MLCINVQVVCAGRVETTALPPMSGKGWLTMVSPGTKDSSEEGTIVNPGTLEGRDTSVGDEGDDANELRFDEEERLIKEQSLRPETD